MHEQYILPIVLGSLLVFRFIKFKTAKRKVPEFLKRGAVILDVRTSTEFSSAGNRMSVNIPLHELKTRIHELDRNRPVIVCCASGTRSTMATMILKKNSFRDILNAGSWINTIVKV